MQRMHADAGNRVEKNTAIGAPYKYCGALEEQHPVFPSWDAQWMLFLTSTRVVLTGKEYNYMGVSLSQNCM